MSNRLVLICAALLTGYVLSGCGGSSPSTPSDSVAQQPNTGVRALDSAAYTPGQPVVVSLSVVPQNGSTAYAIEDLPPAGWTVTNINEGGVYDSLTGKVKWGVYFDQCPLYFTYTATPPTGVTGPQPFVGTLSVDGVNSTISGQTDLPHS